MWKILPIVVLGMMPLSAISSDTPEFSMLNVFPYTAYALLGVEVKAGPLFVGGSAKTYSEGPKSSLTFHPNQVSWEVWAGAQWGEFRLEAAYMCSHPVKPFQAFYGDELFIDMNRARIEVSYNGR